MIENPWAQIDLWLKGFNAARSRKVNLGSCVTPDESMFERKGESGLGGLPHQSYIKQKPETLGTEGKYEDYVRGYIWHLYSL